MSQNKPSPRWGFMSKLVIPDVADKFKVYLVRWRLIQTPWFGVYLHKINMNDSDRHLHDHPWSFISVILKGGYQELWSPFFPFSFYSGYHDTARTWKRWSVHRMMRGEFHGIQKLHRSPTWTLVLVGPRRGEWGFATPSGWVPWREYLEEGFYDLGS